MIPDYLSALRLLINEKAAMLVPKINVNAQDSKTAEHKITKVLTSYTSGSFMSLKAFSAIGGFKNELFIDSVDFEYCLNLNNHGYRIYQVGTVILKHQLGRTKEYKICNKHLFYVTHHNYIRRYYMTRNGIWLRKQYGSRYPELYKKGHGILVSAFKILFFEEDKFKKIRSMYRGYIDYKKGIWGKYRYQ